MGRMATAIRTSSELREYAFTNVDEPTEAHEFRVRFSDLLERAQDDLIRDHGFFSLPADASSWCDTGIDLLAGAAVTVFATAPSAAASTADAPLSDDPRAFQLAATQASEALRGVWYRVGSEGSPSRGPRPAHTFVAANAGRLRCRSPTPRRSRV
jgi:hypothetical protein